MEKSPSQVACFSPRKYLIQSISWDSNLPPATGSTLWERDTSNASQMHRTAVWDGRLKDPRRQLWLFSYSGWFLGQTGLVNQHEIFFSLTVLGRQMSSKEVAASDTWLSSPSRHLPKFLSCKNKGWKINLEIAQGQTCPSQPFRALEIEIHLALRQKPKRVTLKERKQIKCGVSLNQNWSPALPRLHFWQTEANSYCPVGEKVSSEEVSMMLWCKCQANIKKKKSLGKKKGRKTWPVSR